MSGTMILVRTMTLAKPTIELAASLEAASNLPVVMLVDERRGLAGTEEMRDILHLYEWHRRLFILDTGGHGQIGQSSRKGLVLVHVTTTCMRTCAAGYEANT